MEEDGFARRLRVGSAADLLRYAVERGSIGLGGRQPHHLGFG